MRSYLHKGYSDEFWKRLEPTRKHFGVWLTCFVAFDNRSPLVRRFAERWYLHTLAHTTQDQVGFSLAAAERGIGIIPYTFPDHHVVVISGYHTVGPGVTTFYVKHEHGGTQVGNTERMAQADLPLPGAEHHLNLSGAFSTSDSFGKIEGSFSSLEETSELVHVTHIPRTGGTTLRASRGLAKYRKAFPWGHGYTNTSCGVVSGSTFHMTPAELVSCGIVGPSYFESKVILCIVRDPIARAASEMSYRRLLGDRGLMTRDAEGGVLMLGGCEATHPLRHHDIYAHCRPQVEYLYRRNGNGTRIPACDVVLTNASRHAEFLNSAFGIELPAQNLNGHVGAQVTQSGSSLPERDELWVRTWYAEDLRDPAIASADAGYVVSPDKNGRYVPLAV